MILEADGAGTVGVPGIATLPITSVSSPVSAAFCMPGLKSKATGRTTLRLSSMLEASFSSLLSSDLILSISPKKSLPPFACARPSSLNLFSSALMAVRPLASSGSEKRMLNPITLAPACEVFFMTSAILVLGQGHLPSFATDSSSMAMMAMSLLGDAGGKSLILRS